MADKKKTGGRPPPIDPNQVREVVADEFLSLESGGGMNTLVFGKRRLVVQGDDRPPKIEVVVASRLVLSDGAVNDMMKQLVTLSQARRNLNNPSPAGGNPTAH